MKEVEVRTAACYGHRAERRSRCRRRPGVPVIGVVEQKLMDLAVESSRLEDQKLSVELGQEVGVRTGFEDRWEGVSSVVAAGGHLAGTLKGGTDVHLDTVVAVVGAIAAL